MNLEKAHCKMGLFYFKLSFNKILTIDYIVANYLH
jgi:hypothetical protein